MTTVDDEIFKRHLVAVVREHKKRCRGECDLSLVILLIWCKNHGLWFTKEEEEAFV